MHETYFPRPSPTPSPPYLFFFVGRVAKDGTIESPHPGARARGRCQATRASARLQPPGGGGQAGEGRRRRPLEADEDHRSPRPQLPDHLRLSRPPPPVRPGGEPVEPGLAARRVLQPAVPQPCPLPRRAAAGVRGRGAAESLPWWTSAAAVLREGAGHARPWGVSGRPGALRCPRGALARRGPPCRGRRRVHPSPSGRFGGAPRPSGAPKGPRRGRRDRVQPRRGPAGSLLRRERPARRVVQGCVARMCSRARRWTFKVGRVPKT